MLAQRDRGLIARSLVQPEHYSGLARSLRVYERPVDSLSRYFFGTGEWPAKVTVAAKSGRETLTVYSVHDMFTVHELFCRHDYAVPEGSKTIVDIGSNIGISARYFIAQAPTAKLHLFEPVPFNVERLRDQLGGFEDKFTLNEAAVAAEGGRVSFGVEPSGRYCGINQSLDEQISVECIGINEVLEQALETSNTVDLLKIDTEGAELTTLAAIRPDLLSRVRSIQLETYANPNPLPERFVGTRQVMIRRLDATKLARW